jgi:general secretion pathway protein F
MAMYAYKGVDPRGKSVNGVRDADSPKGLRALRRDGILVTDVSEARGARGASGGGGGKSGASSPGTKGLRREVDLRGLFQKVKVPEVAGFTRQLATLLRAGIPLAESLGAIVDQVDNPKLKSIVVEVRSMVNEGSSLADALGKHGKVFEGVYVSMVRAGEAAGNLDQVLVRLADFLEAQVKLKAKVVGAMIYPILMACVSAGVMGILMVAVVPKITAIYQDTDKALPWNTQALIWLSALIGDFWYLFLIAVPLSIWAFRAWVRSASGRALWDRTVLHLPLIGALARQIAIARFCRTFGTMLSSGVALLRSMEISREILGNTTLMKVIDKAREQISQGESIAVTLKRSGEFPSIVTHMIAVGERAGQLEQMLMNVADAFDADTDTKLSRLTSLLEPLMIVVMGGTVAFIVFSILGPIMDMNPTL